MTTQVKQEKHELSKSLDVQNWFVEFLEKLGCNSIGIVEESSIAYGEVYFDKEEPKAYVFDNKYIVRPYYEGPEVDFSLLPNFVNKETGLELYWYKNPLRSGFANMEIKTPQEFKRLVQ